MKGKAESRLSSHFPASFCALGAGLGALLAVVVVVFSAFFRAVLTDIGAEAAQCARIFAVPCHVSGGHCADRRAVHIQFYTRRHVRNIIFVQTGDGAVITGAGAVEAGLDASANRIGMHNFLLIN